MHHGFDFVRVLVQKAGMLLTSLRSLSFRSKTTPFRVDLNSQPGRDTPRPTNFGAAMFSNVGLIQ